jgi:hypothetical protein
MVNNVNAQDILKNLKQQIPNDFIELEAVEGNCMGSTNPK